ncbi:SprT-like domain-containing protein [Marinomonas algarum]|uniref:SprT-like domain-containing protein n=1 Tax=Marinomonas algarum TaxID=2883105 RepID=A0A9X1ILM4_9GAMM|nr:SprT-like domain-containing protein [Marinomonas algarum]MCB5160321.1 SprT-like domain-containing protein [Marinomonas algarum]
MPLEKGKDSSSFLCQISDKDIDLIGIKVKECFEVAERFFGCSFRRASYNFKQKGRAAGTAHLQKNELRFNHFMFSQDTRTFLETVVPHEVSHLIVYQIYGNTVKPHGKEWQAVMRKVYSLAPNRTHNFETPAPKSCYEYKCSCQHHLFTPHRHNRASKGVQYVCKCCRVTLQFIGKK